MLKSLAALLPQGIQLELKRWHWRRKIKRHQFSADEPEFDRLSLLLRRGDIAIDVGANVGQYTRRMATLVGHTGWVISLEPILETFSLLASNCLGLGNVTLLNVAASSYPHEVSMDLPGTNYYRASIAAHGSRRAMAIALDSIPVERLSLIKIDAEGHDLEVLRGAQRCLERFRPSVIIEANAQGTIEEWLAERGYDVMKLPGSPNLVAHHHSQKFQDPSTTKTGSRVCLSAT